MALLTIVLGLLCLSPSIIAGGSHGRPSPLPAETTRVQERAAYFKEYDSKRTTIKYGGVSVPPMTEDDGMAQFFQRSTTLPCQDCFITWLQVGLEHADGTTANADTGMWLHHVVMLNRNQTDAVCGSKGQRFAASGNERTPIDISAGGLFKGGYYIGPDDQVSLIVDLMNMQQSEAQDGIVLTITYEHINGGHAADIAPITPYWFDVGGCETSDQPAYSDSTFMYSSPLLVGDQRGTITFVAGHLHDGGTHIDLVKNEEVVCAASASYDEYTNVDGVGVTDHISSIDSCTLPATVAPGDAWSINAYYDTKLHAPMALMDGSLEPVMGIMLAYVANTNNPTKMARPWYWSIVLGLGLMTLGVISIAAWLWARGRRTIRLKHGSRLDGPSYRDSQAEQEASVPLMNT